jgi:hypothetical protein
MIPTMCNNCEHKILDNCRAFPYGIPKHYYHGKAVHDKVDKDQEGLYIYSPISESITVDDLKNEDYENE